METFAAVKLKMDLEKQELEAEIATLENRKRERLLEVENEFKKFSHSQKLLEEKKKFHIGMLKVDFRNDVVEQNKREINLIEGYLKERKRDMEIINEKMKYIDTILKKNRINEMKKNIKKEEELLNELNQLNRNLF